jgi:hypothetical protein
MKKILSLSLLLLCFLAACTDDEVMQELKSDTYQPNLTTDYWNKEIAENSKLWQQALPYCQDNPLKVNCTNLNRAWTRYVANQRMMAGGGAGAGRQMPARARQLLRKRIILIENG